MYIFLWQPKVPAFQFSNGTVYVLGHPKHYKITYYRFFNFLTVQPNKQKKTVNICMAFSYYNSAASSKEQKFIFYKPESKFQKIKRLKLKRFFTSQHYFPSQIHRKTTGLTVGFSVGFHRISSWFSLNFKENLVAVGFCGEKKIGHETSAGFGAVRSVINLNSVLGLVSQVQLP